MTTEELKAQGNKAFSSGNFTEAVELFSKAIEGDASNHVLYSNRSAAYASLKDFDHALADARKTVELNPTWGKGYSRLGAAQHGLGDLEAAKKAYQDGLQHDAANAQLKKGLEDVERAMADDAQDPFKSLLNDSIWGKIAASPKLSPFLADPAYRQSITTMIQNPKMAMQFMNDQRVMTTLLTLMGLNLQTPADFNAENNDILNSPPSAGRAASPPASPKKTAKAAPEPEPMEVEETEEDQKRKEMLKEKELGNQAYKKRSFDEAIAHYDRAWELSEEREVTVLTNKAAVMFETDRFDECIELCQKAVELGREQRIEYKVIARALARIGNAYLKKDDLDNAIKFFEKSLTEHRNAEVLQKLRDTEKLRAERAKEAYRNPQLADEARERGNALFKEHKYAEAVKEYTEAIKRNDTDPRAYSNRSACYHKLAAIAEALKDCDMCIKLDPNFVKGYIRKAAIQFLKKEYTECMETCSKAKEVDTEKKHTAEIEAQIQKCYMALYSSQSGQQEGGNTEERLKAAMADPEVQSLLSDPVMNQILTQMQSDPGAVREHMKNPAIAAKIRKLVAAGVVGMR
ncbi:Hsp90 cochaperone [Sorochytrium milnesiophthora]